MSARGQTRRLGAIVPNLSHKSTGILWPTVKAHLSLIKQPDIVPKVVSYGGIYSKNARPIVLQPITKYVSYVASSVH